MRAVCYFHISFFFIYFIIKKISNKEKLTTFLFNFKKKKTFNYDRKIDYTTIKFVTQKKNR